SRLAAIGLLDLHHLGAEPCQGLGARRPCLELREVEDLDTLQRRGRAGRGLSCGGLVLHAFHSPARGPRAWPAFPLLRPRPLATGTMLALLRAVDDITRRDIAWGRDASGFEPGRSSKGGRCASPLDGRPIAAPNPGQPHAPHSRWPQDGWIAQLRPWGRPA